MDSYHDIQYHVQQAVEGQAPSMSDTVPKTSLRLSMGTVSETDTSFDSGFLSPSKSASFTAISSHARGAGQMTSPMGIPAYSSSPSKVVGPSAAGELMGRPAWNEDFPVSNNIPDEWDKHFIDNFQENLFGFDAADLNNMVDGILRSPFKSPQNSPFKSPRQGRNAAMGLGYSPFKSLATSNVMLSGPKQSPLRFGGSPFKSPFSSPSPGESGLSPYTRTSPLTRQRRLILQSPAGKPTVSSSEPFSDLPELLANIKGEINEEDDLGVMPFQRTNSFGFVPHDDASSTFSESFSTITSFTDAGDAIQSSNFLEIQQENGLTQIRSCKSEKRESPRRRSAASGSALTAPSNSSITKHSQVITTLHSKDALRLVRARFKEILDKATEDAIQKEKSAKRKSASKPQYPEISHALNRPGPGSAQGFSVGQTSRGKRRQEIRPKPGPNWERTEPVRIAPKKRKR